MNIFSRETFVRPAEDAACEPVGAIPSFHNNADVGGRRQAPRCAPLIA